MHLSRQDLADALSAGTDTTEFDEAVAHLLECRPCQELAFGVVEELRAVSAPLSDESIALLTLCDSVARKALDQLRFEAWWEELRNFASEKQRERIRSVLMLHTPKMFRVVISEASRTASSDPHVGEETALAARLIAELLPRDRCTEQRRNDLLGEAMTEAGNCRRLAANWSGSKAAFREAASLLERGSGDPKLKGRLLSVSASLASDTGNVDEALRLMRQAAECYRKSEDAEGLARVAVKEANTLMAACRFEDAILRATEALMIPSLKDSRLEMLARSIITASLIDLGKRGQALRGFWATLPLYERFSERQTQRYLGARLLDAFGLHRESEKVFRELITFDLEEGLYKNALIDTLTLFEAFYRRGALEKAARLCEESSKLVDTPLCHPQMRQVWEELLAQMRTRALTVAQILEVRLYVNRHWNIPAAQLPFRQPQGTEINGLVLANLAMAHAEPAPQARPTPAAPKKFEPGHTIEVPTDPAQLANGGYQKVRDSVDRQMIEAALRHTGGHLVEAAQLLGLSRNGLEAKVERLGLKALLARTRRHKAKSARNTRLR